MKSSATERIPARKVFAKLQIKEDMVVQKQPGS
jgi:hypothetical protein